MRWVVRRLLLLLLGMLHWWVGVYGRLAVWRVLLRRSLWVSLILRLLLGHCVLILGRR